MKFPLSMTASLAGYIIKNRIMPRPEWQKNVAAAPDMANPFRILPPKVGEKRQPHPMIARRFPIVLMLSRCTHAISPAPAADAYASTNPRSPNGFPSTNVWQ